MKVFRGISIVAVSALFSLSTLALAPQDQSKPEQDHKPPAHETKPAKAPPMAKPQHERAQGEARSAQQQQQKHAQDEARHAQQQEKQAQKQARRAQAQEKRRAAEQTKQAQQAHKTQERHARAQQEQQQKQAEENAKQAQQENARRAEDRSQRAREDQQRQIAQERGPVQEVDRSHHGPDGRADREARIPHDHFREHFGREHRFAIRRPVIIENEPRFEYSGYWFEILDPWPAAWSYDDDCYIDYVDDGYYLFDPVHPGIRISIVIVN